ncbi:MAG: hypothetical protein AMXMBFR26_13400 [Porticoccaceae bacterium]
MADRAVAQGALMVAKGADANKRSRLLRRAHLRHGPRASKSSRGSSKLRFDQAGGQQNATPSPIQPLAIMWR